MKRIIRADLVGVVHTYREDGSEGPVLSKGDVVPDGVVVGDHLLATEDDGDEDEDEDRVPVVPQTDGARGAVPPAGGAPAVVKSDAGTGEPGDPGTPGDPGDGGLDKPAGNASTEAWAEYADAIGVEYDEGAGRDEIRAAVAARDAAAHDEA